MALKDTPNRFGIITRSLHWLCALGFIAQYVLIYRRAALPDDAPQAMSYILLHKSMGMTLLGFGLLFIVWRVLNTHPRLPQSMPRREVILARSVEGCLFLCILFMPLTGYVMSSASGRTLVWFGTITVPNLIAPNELVASTAHATHQFLSYGIIVLFCLHLAGALKHFFIDKDGVLQRMLPFSSS